MRLKERLLASLRTEDGPFEQMLDEVLDVLNEVKKTLEENVGAAKVVLVCSRSQLDYTMDVGVEPYSFVVFRLSLSFSTVYPVKVHRCLVDQTAVEVSNRGELENAIAGCFAGEKLKQLMAIVRAESRRLQDAVATSAPGDQV